MLILHYTGMAGAEAALDRLRDPAARVSAHYVVDEDGQIYRLVAEAHRAWHAGRSMWAGRGNLNDISIGIELVNPGHEWGYRPFPKAQMAALEELARAILARWPIPPGRVLGHSDVAPLRKQDPGELFDWRRLAGAGIGRWPGAVGVPADLAVAEAQRLLAGIGFGVPSHGRLDAETMAVIAAFQRHFRPSRVDGALDGETGALLVALAHSRNGH
ncbi:MAG: N-acetylmuramoyl-L-alanine amidase [Alphaproteobacteria bacterium]|nr:N-acetylmuramoyl-L-alanine amidase [Alphaproteobacteria bacterium]